MLIFNILWTADPITGQSHDYTYSVCIYELNDNFFIIFFQIKSNKTAEKLT